MVEGKARLSGAGQDWGVLGERMNVFEKTPPHCLLVHEVRSAARCVLKDLMWFSAWPRRQ